MNQKEILTAPITDAIIPSGVVDKPSVCGVFNFTHMKLIPLTQGQFAQVDDWNYDRLNVWKWYARKNGNTFYPQRKVTINGRKKTIHMHRLIMNTPDGMDCDHIDHNGVNCQEHNMRNCTHSQNQMNQTPHGKSKYLGVSYTADGKIRADIRVDGISNYLGRCKTEEHAARRHDAAASYYFGEFANLNFK